MILLIRKVPETILIKINNKIVIRFLILKFLISDFSFAFISLCRYIKIGKIAAPCKWLQSTANAFKSYAIHANESPSGCNDESWFATTWFTKTRRFDDEGTTKYTKHGRNRQVSINYFQAILLDFG